MQTRPQNSQLFALEDQFGSPERFMSAAQGRTLVREITLKDGDRARSEVACGSTADLADRLADAFDSFWLRSTNRPVHSNRRGRVRLIDLFSGCGGLSLGVTEACRALEMRVEHVFAADIYPIAVEVYGKNFSGAALCSDPLESLVEDLDSPLSKAERQIARELNPVDVLAGGPPCQGHSDLNNHTRRADPKNALFLTMIRFAQILSPAHVIIENVPGVRHDKGKATARGRRVLERMGYKVHELLLEAPFFGVPQRRRRYMMVATRGSFSPSQLARHASPRSFRWACGDLRVDNRVALDSEASPSRENRDRINYLFDHELHDLPNEERPPCHRLKAHSYNAVYGRLRWDEPAPTITSGFNSPGQGRFVHPEKRRTLTPHEAARLQFIPDFFDWGRAGRENLTQLIGNAVPPKLAYAVALELLR